MKTKFQIRTNASNFGDTFGVWSIELNKFVKQVDYSQGTFEMSQKEARELASKLSRDSRNCWVRLYEMS